MIYGGIPMSEILYVKPEKNVRIYNRVLTLGEAVEMQCADPTIVNRLKTEKLYAFQEVKPGRRSCAGRTVISILDVVRENPGRLPEPGDPKSGRNGFRGGIFYEAEGK